jgi:hypothetical protein
MHAGFDAFIEEFYAPPPWPTRTDGSAPPRPLLGTRTTRLIVDAVARSLMTRDLTVDWGIRQGMDVTGTQ